MIGIVPLLVLAFASYRITRAAARDSITAPLRDTLTNWALTHPTSRWRAMVDVLIQCTYCIGWWISGATLATYLLATGNWHDAPLIIHVIEWAAVGGAQAYLNAGDDTAADAREALAAYSEQARAQAAAPLASPGIDVREDADGLEAPLHIAVPVPGPEHRVEISYEHRPAPDSVAAAPADES